MVCKGPNEADSGIGIETLIYIVIADRFKSK